MSCKDVDNRRHKLQRKIPSVVAELTSFGTCTAGSTLMVCHPWIWVVDWNMLNSICAGCFRHHFGVRRCTHCLIYAYCNSKCQEKHWAAEHQFECRMFHRFAHFLVVHNMLAENMNAPEKIAWLAHVMLLLKIVNKTEKGLKEPEGLGGLFGRRPMQVFHDLKYPVETPGTSDMFKLVREILRACLGKPLSEVMPLNAVAQHLHKVMSNITRIYKHEKVAIPFGWGIYFETAAFRYSCDYNAIPVFNGSVMVIKAAEDIRNYRGYRSIRFRPWSSGYEVIPMVREIRQNNFNEMFGKACPCTMCSPGTEAELNPLQCITVGCTERIPMDVRALLPCPQCRKINGPERLNLGKRMINNQTAIYMAKYFDSSIVQIDFQEECLAAFEMSSLIHPEAHFAFVCRLDVAMYYHQRRKSKKAVEHFVALLPLARRYLPKCSDQLAGLLHDAGMLWMCVARTGGAVQGAIDTFHQGYELCEEALGIAKLLYNVGCPRLKYFKEHEAYAENVPRRSQKVSKKTSKLQQTMV